MLSPDANELTDPDDKFWRRYLEFCWLSGVQPLSRTRTRACRRMAHGDAVDEGREASERPPMDEKRPEHGILVKAGIVLQCFIVGVVLTGAVVFAARFLPIG